MIDIKSIEVRGSKGYNLTGALFSIAVLGLFFILPSKREDSIYLLFKDFSLLKLGIIIILFGAPLFFLYNYFDKRIKLKVDETGIWTKKYGTISWNEIWYFHTSFEKMKDGVMYCFIIKLKDSIDRLDVERKIKFSHMDQEFELVRKIISYYAEKHKINDLGHEKVTHGRFFR